jgi:hypothetical protein
MKAVIGCEAKQIASVLSDNNTELQNTATNRILQRESSLSAFYLSAFYAVIGNILLSWLRTVNSR